MQTPLRLTINYLFALIAASSLFACSAKPQPIENPKIIGVDTFPQEIKAENYTEVLRFWHKKGFRNRTILHISPYDGLAPVPEEKMQRIKAEIKGESAPVTGEIVVTERDYLSAAARMGMLKKIYWVMPFNYLDYIDAEVRVRQYLRGSASHFPPKDIEALRFSNGCVSGKLGDVQIHICSSTSLPSIDEPVITTINSGFFPASSAAKKKNILGMMKLLLDSVVSKRLSSDSLHIVAAADEMALRGYIHEEIIDMLRNPDTIGKSAPSGLWRLRDTADNMLTGGGVKEALALLKERGNEYPDDPYLVLMKATAELLLGMNEKGLKTIAKKCPENPLFCSGLVDAGVLLREQGKAAEAAGIFLKAMQLNPGDARARLEHEKIIKSTAVK